MHRALLFLVSAYSAVAATYYVDCGAGSDQNRGDSATTAWKTPGKVSETTFAPGDSILFRRATQCDGSVWPKGSGAEGLPIRIAAYGAGSLPTIHARNAEAAIKLFDQQNWEVEDLETWGGSPYGVFISASPNTRTLTHFVLRDLVVHDVGGGVKQKASGLIVVSAPDGVTLQDVLIDGVTAYNTSQWAGIYISGSSTTRARHVLVRNSVVHDVEGDGIVLFQTENGRIEKSAAWHTGLQGTETIGTPNAIWTWTCRDCVVENNEGFWADSPGVDGGIYDIDWANDDNVVQHNYGHDAQGYCVAVFGAGKHVTTNSSVRHNVCVNNGRSPKLARRQGDLFTMTWDGGSLDGLVVDHNTFIWNPAIDAPAVHTSDTAFGGTRPDILSNNLIYSSVPNLVSAGPPLKFASNLYWHAGEETAKWSYGAREYATINDWRHIAANDLFLNPGFDWRLRPLKVDAGIGAIASEGDADQNQELTRAVPHANGKWTLLLFGSRLEPDARSQLVFMQTALAQYHDCGLEAEVVSDGDANLQYDWNFGVVRSLESKETNRAQHVRKGAVLLLISPAGEIVRRWDGFAPPAELGLALKHYLGSAAGDPALRIDNSQLGKAR